MNYVLPFAWTVWIMRPFAEFPRHALGLVSPARFSETGRI